MKNKLSEAVEPFFLQERLLLLQLCKIAEIAQEMEHSSTKDLMISAINERIKDIYVKIGIKVSKAIIEDMNPYES